MKYTFLTLLFVFLLSCKDVKKETPPTKISASNIPKNEAYQDLYGSWVGNFQAVDYDENQDYVLTNKINIVIKKIEGDQVTGQNIVAGNVRPIEGKLTKNNGQIDFVLNEPGDDKHDGRFVFSINKDTLSGNWYANNKKSAVTKRSYKLVKQEFRYIASLMLPDDQEYIDYTKAKIDSTLFEKDENGDSIYAVEEYYRYASSVVSTINASTKKLKEKDVKNLKKLELQIIRNTIFARHGYSFKKKSYRQFFDSVDWYIPVSNDVNKELTIIEKENITLLQRFEKYAEDNYDTFGR
jgi:YARHG domain